MTIFLDTGPLVAFVAGGDARHGEAAELFRDITRGAYGAPLTSDLVLAEAMNVIVARRLPLGAADALLALALGSPRSVPLVRHVLRVHGGVFADAVRRYRRHFPRRLSFTDATILAMMASEGIDALATFDGGFRGLANVVPAP